jgi:hypothetical protein
VFWLAWSANQNSEFGYADYKSAVEEAGEEYTGQALSQDGRPEHHRRHRPMLGLFGHGRRDDGSVQHRRLQSKGAA